MNLQDRLTFETDPFIHFPWSSTAQSHNKSPGNSVEEATESRNKLSLIFYFLVSYVSSADKRTYLRK